MRRYLYARVITIRKVSGIPNTFSDLINRVKEVVKQIINEKAIELKTLINSGSFPLEKYATV